VIWNRQSCTHHVKTFNQMKFEYMPSRKISSQVVGWVGPSINFIEESLFLSCGCTTALIHAIGSFRPCSTTFLDSFFCDFQEHRSLDLFCQRSTKLVAATIFTFWICGVFPGLHLGPGFGFLAFNKSSCCFYPSNFNFTVFLRFTYWCLNLSLLALYNWLLVNQLLGALH
jgi:hypothetical protein